MTERKEESHIELQFKENGFDITAYYAVSEKMLHDAQAWANSSTSLRSIDVRDWLDNHDAKLDRSNGPACVMLTANGKRIEEWHREGMLHREDGPAYVVIRANGLRSEEWYCYGVKQPPPRLPRLRRLRPLSSIPGVKLFLPSIKP
jgi:hypothetical protein